MRNFGRAAHLLPRMTVVLPLLRCVEPWLPATIAPLSTRAAEMRGFAARDDHGSKWTACWSKLNSNFGAV